MTIRSFEIADYDAVFALWEAEPGIGLSPGDDSRDGIAKYLIRNPGLSLVGLKSGEIMASILCGHDGRRGYIHHAVVAKIWQGQGLGKQIVAKALDGLTKIGIPKAHVFIFQNNKDGQEFWGKSGWHPREDIALFSIFT